LKSTTVRSGDDLRWLFVFWSREFVSRVFAAGFDWLERIYQTDYLLDDGQNTVPMATHDMSDMRNIPQIAEGFNHLA